jgi:hypothetical protein
VRAAAGALPVLLFRRGGRADRTRNAGARHLAATPTVAAGQLLDVAEGGARDDDDADPLEFGDHATPTVPPRRRMSA